MSLPLCPKHKVPLLPEGAHLLYCPEPSCCHATTRAALGERGKQAKGRQSNMGAFPSGPKVKVLEKDLQAEVVKNLRDRGYEVMEIGKSRSGVKCQNCQQTTYATGWQGNAKAATDLQIRNPVWPRALWFDIELKGSETPIQQEQQDLCDRGGSYICWTWEEVWQAVQNIEGEREKTR